MYDGERGEKHLKDMLTSPRYGAESQRREK